jgi:hypothetical protein
VLIAALSMPLLSRHLPGLTLTLPRSAAPAAASMTALESLGAPAASSPEGGWHLFRWLALHGGACLTAAYAAGLSVCLARLAAGLVLTLRLHRRARPVRAEWVRGRKIRASTEIKSPVSFAGTILLPADHGEWSTAKREAVLAHEEAHIARGDFYVQLAALIHCALFWFSPFAWWLQSKLSQIAEAASDEAAVLRLNDRVTYAEILVEVSRRAQKAPLMVGIAKSGLIQRRVEHILSEIPKQAPSLPVRMLGVAALAAFAIAVASAKAVFGPVSAAARPPVAAAHAPSATAAKPAEPRPGKGALATAVAVHAVYPGAKASSTARGADEHRYDPRALLDPANAPMPRYVPASTVVHAGREFYIRSTERPVADASVTYELDRRTHAWKCAGDSPCRN